MFVQTNTSLASYHFIFKDNPQGERIWDYFILKIFSFYIWHWSLLLSLSMSTDWFEVALGKEESEMADEAATREVAPKMR